LLSCFGTPLAQETGQEQATHPTPAQDAAADQESQEPAILAARFLLILVLVFVLTLAPLTQ
jgi:hypothetical protein